MIKCNVELLGQSTDGKWRLAWFSCESTTTQTQTRYSEHHDDKDAAIETGWICILLQANRYTTHGVNKQYRNARFRI
jgi:hypothetical protein